MLDVRRLRILKEVADRGSLTAAAEALSFSQPAISTQIAKLEQETGTRLIERGTRGVRLTGAGELLVRHADSVLQRLELAETELDDLLHVRRGRCRLGAFPTAFVDLVSRAHAQFKKDHPDVELTLSEVSLDEAIRRLDEGQLDLAVCFDYEGDPSQAVAEHPRVHLFDDPMYLVLPRDHPLARRARIRLDDLRDEPWIEYTQVGPASRMVRRAIDSPQFDPRIVLQIDDLLAIQGLAAAGVGVTVAPGLALPSLRPELVARSLGRALRTRRIFVLWPSSGLSPAAEAMLEVMQSSATALREHLDELAEAHVGGE